MGLFSNDCNMFSGGMFGNAILSSISPETYFNLLAGDAFSIDTGIYINAGVLSLLISKKSMAVLQLINYREE